MGKNKYKYRLAIKAVVLLVFMSVLTTWIAAATPNSLNNASQLPLARVSISPTPDAIISNGLIQLGVNAEGHLNVPGPASSEGVPYVGLRFLPTNAESLSCGCLCEGWGAADNITKIFGAANEAVDGVVGMTLVSFTNTTTNATSIVEIGSPSILVVEHFYHPSVSPNLYQADVSISNIGGAPVELLYRRVMDWDIEPTAFNEFVTINNGSVASLVFTSNNGFASANPLGGPSDLGFTGSFIDAGPDDHGALFDFNFGTLASGTTKKFKIFYGAAVNETEANAALAAVGAEAFSFGQPNTPGGPTNGTPNTFIFAFADVGVSPIVVPSSIDLSITKFEDLNSDGFQDAGEPKLPGWNFTVIDKTSAIVCIGSTDGSGTLSCPTINTSINPPPYTITEELKSGWINTTSIPRIIFPLFTPVNISFGNIRPGEIHGMKWDDRDWDGIKDAGELGVANISICYYSGEAYAERAAYAEGCTLTNESGSYWFMNLTPGFYTVYEELPEGKVQTFPLGYYYYYYPQPHYVTLNSSEIKEGIDFGNANASEIRGMKFNDSDGDGIRDAGESGVPGVGIQLTRMIAPGDEQYAGYTYTDSNGNYSFMGLLPGFYRVKEFPIGRMQTFPANGSPHFVNLSAGEVREGVDFGNQQVPPGEIRGTKFNDSNGNGVQESGEQGVQYVQICLWPSWRCAFTDISGNYSFTDVPVGTYTVYEVLPSGRAATTPAMVTVTVNSSEVKTVNFGNRRLIPPPVDVTVEQQYSTQDGVPTVLRPGLTNLTIRKNLTSISPNVVAVNLTLKWSDGTTKTVSMTEIDDTNIWEATFYPPWPPGTAQMTFEVDVAPAGPGTEDAVQIGDIIFIDPSGQIQDVCTGAPISGANVTLLVEFPPGTGNFVVSPPKNQIPPDNPLTTGADGMYSWMTVPGTYKVKAEKTGYFTAESPPVSVPPPVFNLNISLTPVGGCIILYNISGFKINDTNGNGIWNAGEAGIKGWRITLLDGATGAEIANTSTNGVGFYQFLNLVPGNYNVTEETKAGWINTNATFKPVTIATSDLTNLNFTNKRAPIYGTKFNDLNRNKIRDPGEPGLANWTIRLVGFDKLTKTVVKRTATTDADGNYGFPDLTPGHYIVSEELQRGWLPTTPPARSVHLTEGKIVAVDFGNRKPKPEVCNTSVISGYKFNDTNKNGTFDPGESGLAKWTITISGYDTCTKKPVYRSVVTDASGYYEFADLTQGNYTVSEVLKPGWTNTTPVAQTVTVTSISTSIRMDFGNILPPPPPPCNVSVIYGYKFNDTNKNGRFDSKEAGLANWTIKLIGFDTCTKKPISLTVDTNASGYYEFRDVTAGMYVALEILEPRWVPTTPVAQPVTVPPLSTSIRKDFGNRRI